MSYLLLDDGFYEHPKIIDLSHVAFRFHMIGLGYCSRNLTDGHITDRSVKIIAAIVNVRASRWTGELVESGVWKHHPNGDGFLIHDYLKHNPPAAKVKAGREAAKERMKRIRSGERSTERAGEPTENVRDIVFATPSPPLIALAIPPTPTSYDGEDAHASGDKTAELISVCGGSSEAAKKIRRTIQARKPSHETIVRAIDAARAPARDPLAVALRVLAPKGAA